MGCGVLVRSIKKVKISENGVNAASFTRLQGFVGDLEGGVW